MTVTTIEEVSKASAGTNESSSFIQEKKIIQEMIKQPLLIKNHKAALDFVPNKCRMFATKMLGTSLQLYWSDGRGGGHHACIVVECCAIYGTADPAKKIVQAPHSD